jgi:hypothetical protein
MASHFEIRRMLGPTLASLISQTDKIATSGSVAKNHCHNIALISLELLRNSPTN